MYEIATNHHHQKSQQANQPTIPNATYQKKKIHRPSQSPKSRRSSNGLLLLSRTTVLDSRYFAFVIRDPLHQRSIASHPRVAPSVRPRAPDGEPPDKKQGGWLRRDSAPGTENRSSDTRRFLGGRAARVGGILQLGGGGFIIILYYIISRPGEGKGAAQRIPKEWRRGLVSR